MLDFSPRRDPEEPFEELWKPIEGFPVSGYEVSTRGEIRYAQTKRQRKPSRNQRGVLFVSLRSNPGSRHRQTTVPVARAVAQTFLPDPDNPMRNTLIHKDGDRSNCALENLAYRTLSYANRYHRDLIDPEPRLKRAVTATDALGDPIRYYACQSDLARAYGVLSDDVDIHAGRRGELPFNPGVHVMYTKRTL